MLLYIVRHAYAGQHGDPRYPDDAQRPLTRKGYKQFRRVVKKLARRNFEPSLIATSPLVRCRETADAIAERLCEWPEVTELDALRPGSDLNALVAWSGEHSSEVESLAWVGHSPDVDRMAAALLGAREGAIRFAKGAVAAILFEGKVAPQAGELLWLATPELLGC